MAERSPAGEHNIKHLKKDLNSDNPEARLRAIQRLPEIDSSEAAKALDMFIGNQIPLFSLSKTPNPTLEEALAAVEALADFRTNYDAWQRVKTRTDHHTITSGGKITKMTPIECFGGRPGRSTDIEDHWMIDRTPIVEHGEDYPAAGQIIGASLKDKNTAKMVEERLNKSRVKVLEKMHQIS